MVLEEVGIWVREVGEADACLFEKRMMKTCMTFDGASVVRAL